MAEVTAMRNNATIFPVYGLPYTLVFPILDADGDPVSGASGLDSEISLNGDTPADCTNEATEIGTSGMYYLTLTATEMAADVISGVTKTSTSGAKTTCWTLYPRKLPILLTADNAGAYDSTTTINLGSSASSVDDYYNGCIVYIYGGTGSGQVRMITDYVGSTKIATVHVAWATNPDATSDLKIYRTEQAPYSMGANVTHIGGVSQTARDIGASVLLSPGTGTGQISLASGAVTTGTNNDKTGYALTAAYDAAKTAGTSNLTAQQVWEYATRTLSAFGFSVTVGTNNDKTGYTLTAAYDAAKTAGTSNLTAQQVWEYATRTLSAFGFSVTVGTNNDKTGYALTAAYDAAKTAGTSNLTAQQVWEYATRTLSAFGFSVTVGTNNDKTGYSLSATPPTAAQIRTEMDANSTKLANLDAAITSRLAANGYTAPDNATIAAIALAVASLASEATQAAMAAILDKLDTMLEADGGVSRFTINALEMAPAGEGGGGAAPTVEEIDAQLSETHGSGSWAAASSVVLPVMQGSVYTATALQGREVVIVRGDTPQITFDLGADYTGWTPRFGAKAALGNTDYIIDPKDGSWSDASKGQGYVALTALETATTGRFFAEIEIRKDAQRLTAMKFYLKIVEGVIGE